MPRPTTFVAGFGMDELMFAQFPDSLHQAQLSPSGSPTACITVQGAPVLADVVQRQWLGSVLISLGSGKLLQMELILSCLGFRLRRT